MGKKICLVIVIVLGLLGVGGREVIAQQKTVGAFYKGASMRLIVPNAPGGAYDIWARALAPYLAKHTGARVIVENMPGAGGLVGGGYLFSLAKPDGLTMGILPVSGMALSEMLEYAAVKYELDKFTYIGRIEVMQKAVFASKASGYKTIADMQKSPKVIRFGTVDPTSQSAIEEAILAEAFGLKAKIIPGYKGNKDYTLAVISGRELDAASTSLNFSEEEYVKKGDLTLVAVHGKKRRPDFPNTPAVMEIPSGAEGKKLLDLLVSLVEGGRMILAPPGVPEEKRLFLEKALSTTLKEPALVEWARKGGFNISPLLGKECKQLIAQIRAVVPKAERAKFKHLMTQKYY